jgi:hypothetical protein
MGDARRRRLTLIKGGKAQEAKAHYIAPERLTGLTILMPSLKLKILDNIYDTKVDKATCPTRNSFVLALLEAGMMEFERFYLEQNSPKPPDIELPKSEL